LIRPRGAPGIILRALRDRHFLALVSPRHVPRSCGDGGAARLAGDADLLEIGSIRNVLIVTPTAVVDELDR